MRLKTRERLALKLTDKINEKSLVKSVVYPEDLKVNKGNRQMNGVCSWQGKAYFENSNQISCTFYSFTSMSELLSQDKFDIVDRLVT